MAMTRRAFAYRPFVSTDAAVADLGDVEIELGVSPLANGHRRVTLDAPELGVNLGIMPDSELVGDLTLASDLTGDHHDEATRFEDSGVSLKWVARDGVL